MALGFLLMLLLIALSAVVIVALVGWLLYTNREKERFSRRPGSEKSDETNKKATVRRR